MSNRRQYLGVHMYAVYEQDQSMVNVDIEDDTAGHPLVVNSSFMVISISDGKHTWQYGPELKKLTTVQMCKLSELLFSPESVLVGHDIIWHALDLLRIFPKHFSHGAGY